MYCYNFSRLLLTNPLFTLNNRQIFRHLIVILTIFKSTWTITYLIEAFCKTMLRICKRFEQSSACKLVKTICIFKRQCSKFVQQSYLIARQMAKTYFSVTMFKKQYEIINYGKCFNQLQTVLCSNCFANCQQYFAKCLNHKRYCSSWILLNIV